MIPETMNKENAVAQAEAELQQARYDEFVASVKYRVERIAKLSADLEAEKKQLKKMEFEG